MICMYGPDPIKDLPFRVSHSSPFSPSDIKEYFIPYLELLIFKAIGSVYEDNCRFSKLHLQVHGCK